MSKRVVLGGKNQQASKGGEMRTDGSRQKTLTSGGHGRMARALMWREMWWVGPAERGGTGMEQRVPEAQE